MLKNLLVTEIAEEAVPLTDEEEEVYAALCKHIGPEETAKHDREALLRFVRGYAFEKKAGGKERWIQVACSECDKNIVWRKEVDADTLLTRALPKWDVFNKAWPSNIYGTDSKGHPLLLERSQEMDLTVLLAQFPKAEELAVYQARNLERLQVVKASVSERLGKTIYKHCYILDCGAVGTKFYSAKDHLQAILKVAQYNYPETLYKMFMINTPFIFRAIWAVVSPMVHPITREKVKVLGGDFMKELIANGIQPTQLPKSVGGLLTELDDYIEDPFKTAATKATAASPVADQQPATSTVTMAF